MKNILFLLLLSISTSAFAGNNKFYLGGQVGLAMQPVIISSVTRPAINSRSPKSLKDKISSFKSSLFVGHEWNKVSWSLGAEVSGSLYSSAKKRLSIGDDVTLLRTDLKKLYDVIPAMVIKYQFTETFSPYLKLGIELSKYRQSIDYTDFNAPPAVADVQRSKKFYQTRFVSGVGCELFVRENLFLRAEFSHSFGTKKKKVNFNTNVHGGMFISSAGEIKGESNVKVGCVYKL